MLTEYRRRFIDYRSTSTEMALLCRKGLRRATESLAIFREHRDLFSVGMIGQLRDYLKLQGEGGTGERELIGARRLLGFSIEGRLTSAALQIDEELARQSVDPRVIDAPGLLDDLYGEQLELHRRTAKELGYVDLLHLRTELDGIDYVGLVGLAGRLLELTERVAERSLAAMLRRERQLPLHQASRADLAALEFSGAGAHALRFETRLARYADLFADLGFRTDQQTGLELCRLPDSVAMSSDLPDVWPVRPPERITLGYRPLDGRSAERAFWQSAGAAQMAAWTSASLAPEFQYPVVASDQTLPLAWGMLFDGLLGERQWLTIAFGHTGTDDFLFGIRCLRLIELRLAAARLIYEVEYLKGQVSTRASDRYRELLGLALLIPVSPGDSDDHRRGIGRIRGVALSSVTSRFGLHPPGAASLLRAAVFESQCREHLKSSYGSDWWRNRRAGEMLIDVWNTGYRYPPAELARMVGFGPLDFQWLIDELLRENNEQ